MGAKPKFISRDLARQTVAVTAMGLGMWAANAAGMEHPGVAATAEFIQNFFGNRAAAAADSSQADREWWADLLVNEHVVEGMAMAIERVIEHEADAVPLALGPRVVELAPLAHRQWVEFSKEGAPFLAELQDDAVLTPLASSYAGEEVAALTREAWEAFLMHLLDDAEREETTMLYAVRHLARALHGKLIPAFQNVVAKDLENKGALYAKITHRFLGRIDRTTQTMATQVAEIHQRVVPQPAQAPPWQMPPAASAFFGRGELVDELEARLRKWRRTDVWGGAGFGKTALAAQAVARVVGNDPAGLVSSRFPQGVVFLDLYAIKGDLTSGWQSLANSFQASLPTDMAADARARLACAGRRALVILEGAEQLEDLEPFIAVLALEMTLLVLTREKSQTAADRRLDLDEPLSREDALALLRHLSGAEVSEGILKAVQTRLAGHPLALTWAGSHLADATQPPADFLRDLKANPFTALAEPGGDRRHTLHWLFNRSLRLLDQRTQTVIAAAARIAEPFGIDFAEAAGGEKADLMRLVQLSFLRSGADGWRFAHALTAQFSRDIPITEAQLLRLGEWAREGVREAEARFATAESFEALDLALSHATTLLGYDRSGHQLESLVVSLMQDQFSEKTIGFRLGRLDFARRAVGASLLWHDEAPESVKSTPQMQRGRSVLLNRLGDLARAQGDLAGAARAYTKAKAVAEGLAASDPSNTGWQRDLSISWDRLGDLARAQGDLAGAARAFEEAKAIAERVAASDASNTEWQRDLSVSWINLGDLARAQGDLAGAARAYGEAKTIHERLAASDSSKTGWQRDLSVSCGRLGDLARAQGDLAGAARAYGEAKTIAERLTASDSSNTEWQRNLSIAWNRLGDLARAQGDLAGAARAYGEAKSICERLAASDASNTEWQRDLSISWNRLGDLARAQGDPAGAARAYGEAKSICERLAASDASNTEWQRDLSISWNRLGDLAQARGDLAGAVRAYTEDRRIAEGLALSDPSNAEWQRDLLVTCHRLAHLGGDDLAYLERAAENLQKCFEILQQMDGRGILHDSWLVSLYAKLKTAAGNSGVPPETTAD